MATIGCIRRVTALWTCCGCRPFGAFRNVTTGTLTAMAIREVRSSSGYRSTSRRSTIRKVSHVYNRPATHPGQGSGRRLLPGGCERRTHHLRPVRPPRLTTAPNYLPWGGTHLGAAWFRDNVLAHLLDDLDFSQFTYDSLTGENGHVV